MKAYKDLLKTVLETGHSRGDRTGTGTISCFGLQFRHNLQDGFPLLTTKKMAWNSIVTELLWFLRGDTNIKYLLENDCHIWTDDAYRVYKARHPNMDQAGVLLDKKDFEHNIIVDDFSARLHGDLGPVYGKQWRNWNGIDQIQNVIDSLKKDPEGRRHIVSAWNPQEIGSMALPPCHCMFQFYVQHGKLSCHLYQRSADLFLGVPFNIASYALLVHIIGHQTGLDVGELVISFGDIHIYHNHVDSVATQLAREPLPLPTLSIMDRQGDMQIKIVPKIDQYDREHFNLWNYKSHDSIKGTLSVGV